MQLAVSQYAGTAIGQPAEGPWPCRVLKQDNYPQAMDRAHMSCLKLESATKVASGAQLEAKTRPEQLWQHEPCSGDVVHHPLS